MFQTDSFYCNAFERVQEPFLATMRFIRKGQRSRVDIVGEIVQNLWFKCVSAFHESSTLNSALMCTLESKAGNCSNGFTVSRNWPFLLSNRRRIGFGAAIASSTMSRQVYCHGQRKRRRIQNQEQEDAITIACIIICQGRS